MDHTVLVESDGTSETDDQTKLWESDPRSVTAAHLAQDEAELPAPVECGAIGHRVQASRSVLALVLDKECVFAGLQGGDIVVRGSKSPNIPIGLLSVTNAKTKSRLGLWRPMILCSRCTLIRKVSLIFTCPKTESCSSPRAEILLLM